ncbi:MAG: exodeoxyribonuclease VII large subunit, partial [Chthoniobacterales bacterium]
RNLSEKTLLRDLTMRVRHAQQRVDLAREALGRMADRSLGDTRAALLLRTRAMQSRNVQREFMSCREKLVMLQRRLAAQPAGLLTSAHDRLQRGSGILRVLGPEDTLRRGYSITTDEHGEVISSAANVRPSMRVTTRVTDGAFDSEVVTRADTS